ncbi:MAG TPA: inositol monophosphatase family protein [Candidatus Polarisedimenticolaceae bacterium]|nr:inositol monophosphatase family protein [Candidatus Polarisedimenticolaceae bacterium]
MSRGEDLRRIVEALGAACSILAAFTPGEIVQRSKSGGDPVTEADLAIDAALRRILPRTNEGWLSEETIDDPERLDRERVWVVDPLDGTKEFVSGIPEWCVSIGLVENSRPVAGGICIPARGLQVVGAVGSGVEVNGEPPRPRAASGLDGAEVLASRSEVDRGEWRRFAGAPFVVRPMGSVAAKLALVAAGLTDATWTLVPKHEWDVAGGAALVLAAGGDVWRLDGSSPRFNQPKPKFDGLFAAAAGLRDPIERYFREIGIRAN